MFGHAAQQRCHPLNQKKRECDIRKMGLHLAWHFSKLFIWRPPLRRVHDQHLGFLTCRPAWLWNYGFDLGRSSRGLNGSNEAFRKMIFIRHLNINHKQLGYILYILYT